MQTEAAVSSPRSLSLFEIESDLAELLTLAEDPELAADERAAVEQRIVEYVAAEVRKVDRIAGAIRACKRNAAAAKVESERLAAQAKAWEAFEERLKASTIRAMNAFSVRSLKSATSGLRVQGNGGLEPLEVIDESQAPDEYKRFTVEMSGRLWLAFLEWVYQPAVTGRWWRLREKALDSDLVRQALKSEVVPGVRLAPRGQHLRVE